MPMKALLLCDEERIEPIKRILTKNALEDSIIIIPLTKENILNAKKSGKSGVFCCSCNPVLAAESQRANIRTIGYTIGESSVQQRREIFQLRVRETCAWENLESKLLDLALDTISCVQLTTCLLNTNNEGRSRA